MIDGDEDKTHYMAKFYKGEAKLAIRISFKDNANNGAQNV